MFKRLYIYRVVFFVFLLTLSGLSHAVSIISTKSEYVLGGVEYYFTVTDWVSGNDKFCNDTTASSCGLSIVGARSPGDYSHMVSSQYGWEIKPSTSMKDVFDQMRKKGFSIPFHGSLFVPTATQTSSSFCISFAFGYSWPGLGGVITPSGPCAPVIKPALQCDIKGNTTINHREMFSDAIDGNEAETQLQLTCTGSTIIKVYTRGDDPLGVKLRANEGLYSTLTIDSKKTSNGVFLDIENGSPRNISLKSTLVTKGVVNPGAFSGSTVLMISPP